MRLTILEPNFVQEGKALKARMGRALLGIAFPLRANNSIKHSVLALNIYTDVIYILLYPTDCRLNMV